MSPATTQRLAKAGITIQFLALIRTLAEYFRLKHVLGPSFTVAAAEPYVTGALLAAAGTWLGVTFYFFGKHAWSAAIAAGTVVLLLAYKFLVVV